MFVGAFLAVAGTNYMMFAVIGLFDGNDDDNGASALLLQRAIVVALAGVVLYVIGGRLKPGTVSAVGWALTTIGALWIAFAGLCFYRGYDHLGLQRALIALASLLAALVAAIGLATRE